MNKNEVKSFLGTGWSFPPVFDENRECISMVSDDIDIRQSLKILLTTSPGERVTNPNYGCDLKAILFEPINGATRYLISDTISVAVLYYEPRIDLNDIEINTTNEGQGVIYITLHYTVRQTNSRSNVVFPFYKVEGTNIVEAG